MMVVEKLVEFWLSLLLVLARKKQRKEIIETTFYF
jgi:hypothetical protein